MNNRDTRANLRSPLPLFRTVTTMAILCLLTVAVAACSSSDKNTKVRSIPSTTARPGPAPKTTKDIKPQWVEPAEPVDRASLNLKHGTTAHLAVTAETFGGAGMVPALRKQLIKSLEETSVFGEINVGGNKGHIAVDVVLIDLRDTKIMFGAFKGRPRLKVRLRVTNTRTMRRLSPEDPANLFYGNVKDVSGKIAEYIAG